MAKELKFNISGIHCASCKTLIESEVGALPGVEKIEVNYQNGEASVIFDGQKETQQKIFSEIEKLNYSVAVCEENNPAGIEKIGEEDVFSAKKFLLGLFIPLILVALGAAYFYLRKSGGFDLIAGLNEGNVSYGLILLIGVLAGFHCVGMCGGLVVAYSAGSLKEEGGPKKTLLPHLQYNSGRLISYTIVGAVLGGIGSFFGVNPVFTGVVILLAGAFMVLMGLSFINNWPLLEKIKLRTPQSIAKFLYGNKYAAKVRGPFLVGILNAFMPCGPLQAMQLYALSSGSITRGGASMAIYALGTIPIMFGFGATLTSLGQKYIGRMIKISGILVVVLGLIMINRGLANFGYGFSINSGQTAENQNEAGNANKEFQEVKMDLTYLGYQPNVLYIKEGEPVRWIINVKQMSGCTNAIMIESLGIKKDLSYGENIIEFTPPKGVKEIKFSCWMRMVWGKFVVTN